MITKSPQEAAGVPTTKANAHGVSASKMGLRMLADQKFAPMPEIGVEQSMLEAETRAIVDRALELGECCYGIEPRAGQSISAPFS